MSNTEQGNKNSNSSNNKKAGGGNAKKRTRRPRNNRKRKPGSGNNNNLSGFEKVERAYLNLLEKHLESRRKYYDLFHRADPRQLAKLERSFYRTLSELREYEDNLKPELKEKFDAKYNGLSVDNTYSTNHEIPFEAEPVAAEGDFDDPHLLPTQKDSSYSEDTEESVGSMEDYNSYKGL